MERKLGSPPRRRGKAKERNVQLNLTRITPAWAGKSYGTDGKMPWLWDHPRVGGEKSKHCRASTSLVGSPPRGRGKGPHLEKTAVRGGITPAWAGKRRLSMLGCVAFWDHPRVGGEKLRVCWGDIVAWGSPPRGRGKGWNPCWRGLLNRITPAWAGKSPASRQQSPSPRDHPRVGGEKGG